MTTEQVAIERDLLRKASRTGLTAAVLLGILTIVEYLVAIGLDDPLLALLPFVVLKGWIILDTFMHIRALFGQENH